MGVEIKVLSPGNGTDFPKAGSDIVMNYTGCLYDDSVGESNHFMGQEFDSTSKPNRGPFEATIGVGELIQGWDRGVPQMSLGEKAILTCTPDYGYGDQSIPGLIPANSTLVFEVELLEIDGKKA